ncbi:hypothetical protein FQR65_LT03537 [Abscondita terminalis]|nr:hypothetical protein FQR65_LT03537 [Abscondita terminalis]
MLTEVVVLFLCCHIVTPALEPIEEPVYANLKKLFNFIESNFRDQYNILAVTGVFDDEIRSLLDWTLVNYQTTPTIVTAIDRSYMPVHAVSANVIIVMLKNVDFINATLDRLVKRSFFTYRSYVFFVLAEETFSDGWFFPIGAYVWQKRILNVFFVFYDSRLQVLTYNPFKSSKLENFTNAAAYTQMFHNKVKQMNGHVIRGGTVQDIPRAVYRNGELYVTDKLAVISIIQHLNASVKETYYPSYDYYKIIDEILLENLDCAFITQWLQNVDELNTEKKLQFSNPYSLDAALIILPRPKYIPTYLNIFFIFQGTLWIFLIVTYVLVTLMTALLDSVALKTAAIRTSENSIFQTIRTVINLPSTEIKKSMLSKKILFLFSIWLTFFFHVLFNSSLTSALIQPKRYGRITTLKQLSESDYKIFFYWKELAERSSSYYMLRDHYIFENKSKIFDMIMDGDDEYGYGCNSLLTAEIFVRRSTNKHKKVLFYVLKEAVVPGHRAFIFPQNSPFLATINNYLLLYKEFKIHQRQFGNAEVQKNLIPEKPVSVATNDVIKNVVLSLDHVQTSFYILGLGLMMSTLVFVGEQLTIIFKQKRLPGLNRVELVTVVANVLPSIVRGFIRAVNFFQSRIWLDGQVDYLTFSTLGLSFVLSQVFCSDEAFTIGGDTLAVTTLTRSNPGRRFCFNDFGRGSLSS